LGSVTALFLVQRISLIDVRTAVLELQARVSERGASEAAMKEQLQSLRASLQTETNRTAGLHGELATISTEPDGVTIPPLTPETDGVWPENQKWFYLPKAQLTRLGYDTFLIDGRLSEEAALLFGMSASERGNVEDALAELKRALTQLELANLKPAAPQEWDVRNNPKMHLEAYQLPALDTTSLRSQFQQAMQTILGDNRASFFVPVSDAFFARVLDDLGTFPRLITHFTTLPNDPEPWARIDVWNTKLSSGKCMYPEDETGPGFRYYSQLVAGYSHSTNSPTGP
jgi:hypothetical protein